MGASRTPTLAPRSGGTSGSLCDNWDGVRRSDVEAERTQLPAVILGDLVGPQGGSPRRRRSGVNRHSSSRPVGTGNPPVALLIGVPSGDLSGRGSVLVVARGAAGPVMALLPPRIGIMRCRGRPPCGRRGPGPALTDAQPSRRRLAGPLAVVRPGRFRLAGGRLPRAGHAVRVAGLAFG
jgi:hypothetical protein